MNQWIDMSVIISFTLLVLGMVTIYDAISYFFMMKKDKKTKEKFTKVVLKDADEENPGEDAIVVEAPLKKGDTLQFIGDKLYVVHGDDVNAPKEDK